MSASKKRTPINKDVEAQVLIASRRRCCLCFFLEETRTSRKGQIAHLDHNSAKSDFSNLVYLCLEHHDGYDSKSSQSKNYTVDEVRYYRDRLYKELENSKASSLDETISNLEISDRITSGSDQVNENKSNRLDFIHEPWRLLLPVEGEPQLFAYKSPNRFDGICRIEQNKLRDGRTVIICEQVDENPGISITNALEDIAFQVCDQFQIDPHNLIWIEHYDTWYAYALDDRWVLISFEKMPPETPDFQNPRGKIMTEEDWNDLGFHPRKRRSKHGKYPTSLVVGNR